jgi:hypothetical protein
MNKLLGAVALALLVTACASAFVPGAQTACAQKGAVAGTQEYNDCVTNVANERAADFSQRLTAVGAAMRSADGGAPSYAPPPAPSASPGSMVCMYRSQAVSGFNKICYYDCTGSTRAETISSTSLCPLTL